MKNAFLLAIMMVFAFSQAAHTQDQPKAPETVQFLLQWDVASTASTAQYRAEYYSVWVSTSGSGTGDFTHMIWDETLSTEIDNWVYQAREVDITEFGGEIVHIAFRHHESTDMDRIMINNVKLVMQDASKGLFEEVLIDEDFNDGVGNPLGEDWLPEGWLAIDADDDGHNWYFNEYEGDGYMLSRSVINIDGDWVPLTPDNFLITPEAHLVFVGQEETKALMHSLYPNPANDQVRLHAAGKINQIIIYDLHGRVVHEQMVNQSKVDIPTAHFDSGLYILRMITDTKTADTKLQIAR